MATLGNKKLARTMEALTSCISELAQERDALRLALTRITNYQSPEHLRKHSEKEWGLDYVEALEGSYENVLGDAERALRWKPQPKPNLNGHICTCCEHPPHKKGECPKCECLANLEIRPLSGLDDGPKLPVEASR